MNVYFYKHIDILYIDHSSAGFTEDLFVSSKIKMVLIWLTLTINEF